MARKWRPVDRSLWTTGRIGQLPKPSKGKGVFVSRKGKPYDRRGKGPYQQSGAVTLRKGIRRAPLETLLARTIDANSEVGLALSVWRSELVADLGGPDVVSTQQKAVVEICIRTKLILDSLDAFILTQKTLIRGRDKSVFPVVVQRQQIANGLAQHLSLLGLNRRAKPIQDLTAYLASKYGAPGPKEPAKPEPVVIEQKRFPVIRAEE